MARSPGLGGSVERRRFVAWPDVVYQFADLKERSPTIMTIPSTESRDWQDTAMDWVAARWRWLVAAVVLLFALNNFLGFVVGGMGFLAFANRVVGRVLKAQRVVQQVQQIVASPDDVENE